MTKQKAQKNTEGKRPLTKKTKLKDNREQPKMSVSAMLGPQLVAVGVALKNPSATVSFGATKTTTWRSSVGSNGTGLVIECSSRPQKKATAHHRKTRPRKTQPWDVKRKPTVYTPLPPLPADWTFVSSGEATSSPPQEPPTTG